jgi:hypothetical protein
MVYSGTVGDWVHAAPTTVPVFLSDAGAAVAGSASTVTLLAGTKPDIRAGSLNVGDVFRFHLAGSFETVGGAASTLTLAMIWDAVNVGTITSASIPITNVVGFELDIECRVLTLGASGTVEWSLKFTRAPDGILATTPGSVAVNSGTATVDTTQALTVDFTCATSSSNANNTTTCTFASGTYHPMYVPA